MEPGGGPEGVGATSPPSSARGCGCDRARCGAAWRRLQPAPLPADSHRSPPSDPAPVATHATCATRATADPVRVGILGTSWWIARMHLPALASHPGARLVAVAGRDAGRAGALAERAAAATGHPPRAYTSWQAMLADGALDAVIVATPDDLHAAMTCAALDAGAHVCCEKPLARTAADARAMWDAAEARGLLHMTYFTYRWLPHYRLARAVVAAGRLGRVRQLHVRFLSAMGRARGGGTIAPPPADPWRRDPRRSGGVLTDLGTHVVDLVRVVAGGEIQRVAASVRADAPPAAPGDATSDAVLLLLEGVDAGGAAWHGTAHATLGVAVGDRGLLQSLVVVGERATLTVDVTIAGAELWLHRDGASEPLAIPEALGGALAHPFAAFERLPVGTRLFVDAVRARRDGDAAAARSLVASPEWASFADGWAAQAVVDAAAASAREGRAIDVRPIDVRAIDPPPIAAPAPPPLTADPVHR